MVRQIKSNDVVKVLKKDKKVKKKRSLFLNSFIDCVGLLCIVLTIIVLMIMYKILFVGFIEFLIGILLISYSIRGFRRINKLNKQKNFNVKLNLCISIVALLVSIFVLIFPVQMIFSEVKVSEVIIGSSEFVDDKESLLKNSFVNVTGLDYIDYRFYKDGKNSVLLNSENLYSALSVQYKKTIKGNIVVDYDFK